MELLTWLIIIGLILLIPTAYAAKIGAPYAPTFSAAIKQTFDYIELNDKDLVVDIGAGDGRVLLAANQRHAKALGYELSPIMAAIIWLRALGKPHVKVRMSNFYKQKLPSQTTIIFAFLMPENMARVKDFLAKQDLPNLRYILVYAFPFKEVEPLHIVHAPKCARLYIYHPADVVNQQKKPNLVKNRGWHGGKVHTERNSGKFIPFMGIKAGTGVRYERTCRDRTRSIDCFSPSLKLQD